MALLREHSVSLPPQLNERPGQESLLLAPGLGRDVISYSIYICIWYSPVLAADFPHA